MPISTSGRAIKARRKGTFVRTNAKTPFRWSAMKYNHIRVQFSDGSERHMLFTDPQVERAMLRASKKRDLPKITWIRELWYQGIIETNSSDVDAIISDKELPQSARKYNHVRVNCDGEEVRLLFTDNEIRIGLDRADDNKENLPKISWLSDELK